MQKHKKRSDTFLCGISVQNDRIYHEQQELIGGLGAKVAFNLSPAVSTVKQGCATIISFTSLFRFLLSICFFRFIYFVVYAIMMVFNLRVCICARGRITNLIN